MSIRYPDVVVGCTGGGSNFGGIAFPFIGQKFRNESEKETRFVAVEPAACPSLTKGVYCYDFGDCAQMTPLMKAHTLGSSFMPPSVHSGGLRYHSMAPAISHLAELGVIEPRAVQQMAAFDAGHLFMKTEGILPAPEVSKAVKFGDGQLGTCPCNLVCLEIHVCVNMHMYFHSLLFFL